MTGALIGIMLLLTAATAVPDAVITEDHEVFTLTSTTSGELSVSRTVVVNGKDGIDGVGVTDVTITDGNLIITLSDGRVINAGRIAVENHVTIPSGAVKTFYFNTAGSDITKVIVNGEEITKENYDIESYGEGALVTIEEETIPLSGAEIKVETTTGTETVQVQAQNTGNSVPWWVIYVLIGLNVLTGGAAVLALAKKNK